jgi:hypothetical protein
MGLLWMREKHVITLDSFRYSTVFIKDFYFNRLQLKVLAFLTKFKNL